MPIPRLPAVDSQRSALLVRRALHRLFADWALTERPACFEIDPRKACGQARLRMSVARSSSLRTTLRNDLLFTMSDNLHRAIEDRRDTNSDAWTSIGDSQGFERRSHRTRREGWWSQTESNRRPPACKAGALPTELWPLRSQQSEDQRTDLRSRRPRLLSSSEDWWAWEDLNFRPHAYQARALTS